ncbi:hypothetical protein [Streptomyces sp. NPDC002324]
MTSNRTPRTVLGQDAYSHALYGVRNVVGNARVPVSDEVIGEIVAEVLTAAGLLVPAPKPAPGKCASLWPDDYGDWWQCDQDPHDEGRHLAGDFGWLDSDPEAIPSTAGAVR